jgi:hypothetical protein
MGGPKASLVAFLDFGNAWDADGEMDDWLSTGGAELRVNLSLFVLAYGTAQDFNRWRDKEVPTNYLRLSLINPF